MSIDHKRGFVTLATQRPWQVCTPTVYRYMEQKYVDLFFETGELRLTSFRVFSTYKDEERADSQEGKSVVMVHGKEHTAFIDTLQGMDALMMCTSTINSEENRQRFDGGAIEIYNTFMFGQAISMALAHFVSGWEGPCLYQDWIECQTSFDPEQFKNEQGEIDMGALLRVGQTGGHTPLFRKAPKYAHQSEYRFVWLLGIEPEDYVTIRCPQAREYCRPCPPKP